MSTTLNSEKLALYKRINIRSSVNESFTDNSPGSNKLAGFLQNGKFSWIAHDAIIRVVSTDSGVEVSYYNFARHHGANGCQIFRVEEIDYVQGVCILAVSLEFLNGATAGAGMISIYCVQGSKILGSMDMCERITAIKYLDWETCRRSALRQFHGTLAIGTEQGKLFLVDLMIPNDVKEIVLSPSHDAEIFPMIVTQINEDVTQISIIQQHKKLLNNLESGEKYFFAVQLKPVLEDSGAIISFLCMPNLFMMAVGLSDGRMILYDLIELEAFHLAYPPGNESPLIHMSFIEPADDPRSAVYIWAFHASKDGSIAVMHSIMFEARINGYYENFRSCSVRLTMPMFAKDTFPVCCRSITKPMSQDSEEILTINLLAWTSPSKNRTNIMIFDLNQWYKEEMPNIGDWRNQLKYTVVFEIPNVSLDILMNEESLMPFNSILRPEEHFYPNSLSFNLVILECDQFSHYRWNGVQNQVLQQFNIVGPQMILEPSFYFNELLQVSITPQFYDVNFSIASPIEVKREFLLSVALEYNFTGFLKKCAWAWADGSYMGKNGNVGVGLSTLIEWIWSRVLVLKDVSNSLCEPLFDFSEQRIDCGTQKQLSMCCKQLKILSELLQIITRDYRRFIPDNVFSQIQGQADTVKMASDYQEVLQWLLNVGLLPEGHHNRNRELDSEDDFVIVPYPYRAISSHYETQRSKFAQDDLTMDSKKKYLFIDALIENECNGDELIKVWSGDYPPKSIQSLLRTLLIPDISTENKYVIFIYLFMDITNVLNESSYSSIVRNLIKFPAVFKINPSVIKRTQAFWNLDNGSLETAVEELISPLSNDRHLPKWHRELLIGALLKQNAHKLALRALRCPGNPISAELEVATLLANNLLSEALKVQRGSGNRKLLEKFFDKILHSANYEQLLDLALTEEEGKVLRDYLQNTDLSNSVNLHFVYLLQRSKFIDAAHLMDLLNSSSANMNLESPKQVLNAYYTVMEPTTRKLTSMAYADNHLKPSDSLLPLSCNLINSRCNASNDIYKKCVQSINEATQDIVPEKQKESKEMPFIGMPKLGMFEYRQQSFQPQEIAYPMQFNEHGKRPKLDNNNTIFKMEDIEGPQTKRRRVDEVLKSNKFKSYVDQRINLLTNFRQMRPKMNFMSANTTSTSSRTTPVDHPPLLFGEALATPIVEKRTPIKTMPERAGTPHSILKTRSCRSSVSPTNSRFSEMDDNKSVKSITFAAMPDTRESSLNNSSYLDESFAGADQVNSSAEIFYSPEKPDNNELVTVPSNSSVGLLSGPKPRPPINKSRSITPQPDLPVQNMPENEEKAVAETELEPISPSHVNAQSTTRIFGENIEQPATKEKEEAEEGKAEMIESSSSDEDNQMFKREGVWKSSDEESDSESDVSIPNESIYQYERKSVLETTKDESSEESDQEESVSLGKRDVISSSDSCEDLLIAEDEHFEEEQLPEHSDYDDGEQEESISDDMEYGSYDVNDSSEEEIHPETKQRKPFAAEGEVIELLDSDDDDVQIQAPPAPQPSISQSLPSFNLIEQQQQQRQAIMDEQVTSSEQDNIEKEDTEPHDETKQLESREVMMDILYSNLDEQAGSNMEVNEEPVEMLQFEIIAQETPSECLLQEHEPKEPLVDEVTAEEFESLENVSDEPKTTQITTDEPQTSEITPETTPVAAIIDHEDENVKSVEQESVAVEAEEQESATVETGEEKSKTLFIEQEQPQPVQVIEQDQLLERETVQVEPVDSGNVKGDPQASEIIQEELLPEEIETAKSSEYEMVEQKDQLNIVTEKIVVCESQELPTQSDQTVKGDKSSSESQTKVKSSEDLIEDLEETASENPLELAQFEIEVTTTEETTVVEEEIEMMSSSNLTEQTENSLDNARIEEEESKVETSEAFLSANSEIQIDSSKKENISEEEKEEKGTSIDIGESIENPLEVAIIEDTITENDSAMSELVVNEGLQSPEKTYDVSAVSETTMNPLEVAQIDIEETQVGTTTNTFKDVEIEQNIDSEDKEIEEIMKSSKTSQEFDQKDAEQTKPVDLSTTPRRRPSRAKSETAELAMNIRNYRAASVPASSSSSSSTSRSRSSLASSELHTNPKGLLKEKLLDRIEESPSGMMTRYKSKIMSQGVETTPQTPTKTSRAPSEEVDSARTRTPRRSLAGTPTSLTPRRILTRAISKESIASSVASSQLQIDEKTPEEPTTSRRRERKKKTASDDESDDVKSTISGRSTSSRKKVTSVSSRATPETSPTDDLNMSTRRLTRGQLAVLEKSRNLAERVITTSSLNLLPSASEKSLSTFSGGESENESVMSEKSGISKRSLRSTRKRKVTDDSSSVTSKKSKSPSKQKQHLSIIPEENFEASTIERKKK